MNSLLLGLYACVFDTGHCFPSEKQMIYTLLGGENWLIKISFQGGGTSSLCAAGDLALHHGMRRQVRDSFG